MIRLLLAEILPVTWCVVSATLTIKEINKNNRTAALGGPKDEEQP